MKKMTSKIESSIMERTKESLDKYKRFVQYYEDVLTEYRQKSAREKLEIELAENAGEEWFGKAINQKHKDYAQHLINLTNGSAEIALDLLITFGRTYFRRI